MHHAPPFFRHYCFRLRKKNSNVVPFSFKSHHQYTCTCLYITLLFLLIVDSNECSDNNGGCTQNCRNLDPGFECYCDAGFTLSADGSTCADVNECSTSPCGGMEICVNTFGDYICLDQSKLSEASNTCIL